MTRHAAWRIARILALVLIVLLAVPYLIAPFYRFINPVSTLMLARWLTGERVERVWVPLESMSRALPVAVIIAEDQRFCAHHGIDFTELREAVQEADDISEMRGGSTITQQTVKNLFLWGGRSYVRKVLEAPLALWFNLAVGKRRTLEIYLNIAQWGPNGEFGAEAGARRAFGRSAREITPEQAALLAAVLPSPARRDAHSPSLGMRRIAGIYRARATRSAWTAACLRLPRPPR